MMGIMGIKDGFMISKGLVTSLLSKKAPLAPTLPHPSPLNTLFSRYYHKVFY